LQQASATDNHQSLPPLRRLLLHNRRKSAAV
jgi:hypothetical protein